jgi:Protein of unknwon function (DUF3310)
MDYIMTSVFYEKFIAGKDKPVSDGMTEMAREDAYAMLEDALSKQVGGNHYANMKIQPVEFITANNLTFLEGNVVKYISRHHAKNGADDVKKAIHYCELILKTVYGV